jgi:hypothetical protein
MIDYFKIDPILPERIWKNIPLRKILIVDSDSGEVIREEAIYKNLSMAYYPSGRLILKGSIHKSFNDGLNHDDFTFDNLNAHLKEISKFLGFDLFKCELRNVEYGVNINPPILSRKVIDGLLFFRTTEFKDLAYVGRGICKKAEFQRYQIKCYDKKAQYTRKGLAIESEILRFEIHVSKMDYLRMTSINKIEDLLHHDKLKELKVDLLNKWNGILFFDPTVKPKYCNHQDILNSWSNPNYFRALREMKGGHRKVMKEIERLGCYMLENSDNIKQRVSDLIENKWNQISGQHHT